MTKGPLFLQDKERVKTTLSKRKSLWSRERYAQKLNEVQEVLLNDKDFLKRIVESFCQKLKDVEMTQFLQADKYQRQDERCGYRNGYKPRKLKTRVGALELLVPKTEKANSGHSFLPSISEVRKHFSHPLCRCILEEYPPEK